MKTLYQIEHPDLGVVWAERDGDVFTTVPAEGEPPSYHVFPVDGARVLQSALDFGRGAEVEAVAYNFERALGPGD